MKHVIMQFPPASCYFLSDQSALLSTLLSNTLNRCSSRNVTDQVSNPYFAIQFLGSRGKDKHSELNGTKHSGGESYKRGFL